MTDTLPRGTALDVTLRVTGDWVHLTGAGVDVSAPHGGVLPGLQHALHDVRRERARCGRLPARDRAAGTAIRDLDVEGGRGTGLVSLRRAGELLAASFLPTPVSAALAGLLRRAFRETVALRISVDAPGLAGLPWEAMPEPVTGLPLALHPNVRMYRATGTSVPAQLAGPLRIVVAIASPDTGSLLDYEHELRAVLSAVRGARRSDARVEVVPFATTREIRAALDVPGGVHVLHISAHGQPGVLILEDEDGKARPVTADQLVREAVPLGRMPPVIALAACYSDVDGEEQGSSYALQLADRGACAVIGTQTSVTDRYATLLFARIYAELADSPDADVVRAVTDARRLVQQDLVRTTDPGQRALSGMDEWGVVTLLAAAPRVAVLDHGVPPVAAPHVRAAAWGRMEARPVGQFVGRRQLQRTLPAILDSGTHAGVVLHGIGGVGKTTLAAEILRRIVEHRPAWRVAALVGPVTVDGLLAEVAAVAGRELILHQTAPGRQHAVVQAAGQVDIAWRDRFSLLREVVLDDVPILVVLDNFEDNLVPDGNGRWAVSDAALVDLLTEWTTSPGRSQLLITSRHPPDVARQRLLLQPVGPLTAAEAAKLLWSLPHLDRHATTDTTARVVWRAVGGHPRSLEYLDALLGQGTARFDDITARLTRAVETRLGPQDTASWLAQDRTLDAALADIVTLAADDVLLADHLDRLSRIPGALEVLAAVSVYREAVPVTALAFHAGNPVAPEQAAAATARHLAERRTVTDRVTSLLAAHRLVLGDLGTDVVRERLDAAEYATLEHFSDEFWRAPRPPYDPPARLPELLEILRDSSLIHHDPAADMVFMHRWTATELHRRWRPPAGEPGTDRVGLAHRSAAAYWQWRVTDWAQSRVDRLHDLDEARHHLLAAGDLDGADIVTQHSCEQLIAWSSWDRAASLIHDTLRWLAPDRPSLPDHHLLLGTFAQRRRDFAEAERRYQLALAAFKRFGDRAGAANAHHQLGMLAHDRNDQTAAEDHYRRALTLHEDLGNRADTAKTHHQFGNLAYLRGDRDRAGAHYQDALAVSEEFGDLAATASTRHQLGILAHDRGDHAEAEHHYRQALAVQLQLGDRKGVAATHQQIGNLAHLRGDHIVAADHYQQALTINEELGDWAGTATNQHGLGMIAHSRGDHAEANHRYERALAVARAVNDREGVAATSTQLGNLRTATGNIPAATGWHIQALDIRLDLGAPRVPDDLAWLARIRAAIGVAVFAEIAEQVLSPASHDRLTAALDAVPDTT